MAPRNIFEADKCVATEFNVTNSMICEGRQTDIQLIEKMTIGEYYAALEAVIVAAQKKAEEIDKITAKYK